MSLPAIRLSELHPIIVHFPIALLLTSVALDMASVIFRRGTLTQGATWMLIIGTPGALAALASGWLSEKGVSATSANGLLHLHKICAVAASAVFGVLFLLRILWVSPRLLDWLQATFPNRTAFARLQALLWAVLPLAFVKTLPRKVVITYLLLSIVGVFLLALTGYLGGAMVYDHGVGVPLP